MAIMAIVFAAILPQFRAILNSWDSKQASAEILQNGRVLIDHLNHNLTEAARITAVSNFGETAGYLEFEDNDGNTLRYDVDANNYVEFGLVGDLYELAGRLHVAKVHIADIGPSAVQLGGLFHPLAQFVRPNVTE